MSKSLDPQMQNIKHYLLDFWVYEHRVFKNLDLHLKGHKETIKNFYNMKESINKKKEHLFK